MLGSKDAKSRATIGTVPAAASATTIQATPRATAHEWVIARTPPAMPAMVHNTTSMVIALRKNTTMTRPIMVEADPLTKFFVADRAARQTVLLAIYDWTKALGEARLAARALTGQRDSIKADLASAETQADSLNARIGRVAASIDRAFLALNGQRGPIEGWSGQPTSDQRKAVGYAIDDARKAITDLNKLIATEIPAAYGGGNGRRWTRSVAPVRMPVQGASGKNSR